MPSRHLLKRFNFVRKRNTAANTHNLSCYGVRKLKTSKYFKEKTRRIRTTLKGKIRVSNQYESSHEIRKPLNSIYGFTELLKIENWTKNKGITYWL